MALIRPDDSVPERVVESAARRTGRRVREDRGLPDEGARIELAQTYLDLQRQLWPELFNQRASVAVKAKESVRLAREFAARFLAGGREIATPALPWNPSLELGAAYLRYSCDNSNPRSLDQQLRNVLERARRDNVFVPWEYVFADAAVTGTIAMRRGYVMAKTALTSSRITRLYIDEIGRASRDAIEALRLGRLVEQSRKRLIGVTDGFDSETAQSKLMLSIIAMLHESFIDQLRHKVHRGMEDSFRRGHNINSPPTGYRLEPARDKSGTPIVDADNRPVNVKAVDAEGAVWVRMAFELYTQQGWSRTRIARHFNTHAVDGRRTWDGGRIRQLLTRTTYIGQERYRMTRQIRDPETGVVKVMQLPQKDRLIRDVPELRLISDELWEKTQLRLAECSAAYAKKPKERSARAVVYPKTLFRPVCGDCGRELGLGRSGKYASYCCISGRGQMHRCGLRTYKSVRMVEKAILDVLRAQLFSEEFLVRVLRDANDFIIQESERPLEDTAPLLEEVKSVQARRDRLVKILETDADDLEAVVEQVRRYERRLKELKQQVDQIASRRIASPTPMTMADIQPMLADLQGLLNDDVNLAAPVLCRLTGPILIREAGRRGTKGMPWVASFTLNVPAALAAVAARRSDPAEVVFESLATDPAGLGVAIETVIG